jgi:hypothetical protein
MQSYNFFFFLSFKTFLIIIIKSQKKKKERKKERKKMNERIEENKFHFFPTTNTGCPPNCQLHIVIVISPVPLSSDRR